MSAPAKADAYFAARLAFVDRPGARVRLDEQAGDFARHQVRVVVQERFRTGKVWEITYCVNLDAAEAVMRLQAKQARRRLDLPVALDHMATVGMTFRRLLEAVARTTPTIRQLADAMAEGGR